MNYSGLSGKLLKSSRMLKNRGKLHLYFLSGRFPFQSISSYRQRKLKEAREAAEIEVAKYRK